MPFAESGGPVTHCTSWAPGGEEVEPARPLKGEWRACCLYSEAGPETRGSQWPALESPGGLNIPPSSSEPSGHVPSTKLTTGGGHSPQDPPEHRGATTGLGCGAGQGTQPGYPEEGSLRAPQTLPFSLLSWVSPSLPLSFLLSCPWGTALVAGDLDLCSLWNRWERGSGISDPGLQPCNYVVF